MRVKFDAIISIFLLLSIIQDYENRNTLDYYEYLSFRKNQGHLFCHIQHVERVCYHQNYQLRRKKKLINFCFLQKSLCVHFIPVKLSVQYPFILSIFRRIIHESLTVILLVLNNLFVVDKCPVCSMYVLERFPCVQLRTIPCQLQSQILQNIFISVYNALLQLLLMFKRCKIYIKKRKIVIGKLYHLMQLKFFINSSRKLLLLQVITPSQFINFHLLSTLHSLSPPSLFKSFPLELSLRRAE